MENLSQQTEIEYLREKIEGLKCPYPLHRIGSSINKDVVHCTICDLQEYVKKI